MKRLRTLCLALIRSALRGLRASAVTTAVAVVTIGVALLLVGGFALLVSNMGEVVQRFGEELQVVAYLDADVDAEEGRALATTVATVEGVASVVLVSKADALERFRQSLGGASLLEGLEGNPLPASLEIALLPDRRTPAGLDVVVAALSGLPGIEDLAHGQEWVEGYARFASLVRVSAIALAVVLGLAALMIVANTIRLAIYARQDELEILLLVGASRAFVRIPFLVEGTVQGVLGGGLAVLLLFGAFHIVLPELEYGLELILGNVSPHFFSSAEVAMLMAGGGVLGMIGSITALVGWKPVS